MNVIIKSYVDLMNEKVMLIILMLKFNKFDLTSEF